MYEIDLTKVKPTKEQKPPIICLYGTEKIGKTTFASQAPNPFFIFTENGTGLLELAKDTITKEDRISGQGLTKFFDILKAFREQDHGFQTLVIDSLDWLEEYIYQQVCLDNKVDSITKVPMGDGWVQMQSYWIEIANYLEQIRDEKECFIIMLCHYQIKTFNDPRGDAYEQYDLKLSKKGSAKIKEFCDAIGFATHDITRKTEKTGFGNETKKGIVRHRAIYWQFQGSAVAGNRYGLEKTNLDWSDFFNQLSTKY